MRTPPIAAALAGLLLSAAPASAAELKIGYVDFQRALNEVEEGQVAKATLKHDFDEKQKQLDKDKTELERLQAEFEKQAGVMSDDAKRDRAMEIDRRMREAQGKAMGFQKELSDREREVTRAIFDKMFSLTREIADADGLTYVFDKNSLLVAPPAGDITNELVRKYNERFKPDAKKKAAPKKGEAKKGEAKK
ncbi:MAG TPA: OmpH family outer membrane protein [Anaeromyxobacteraceae bacterium]|nr:OmpH family outer membrane protein [Anaeromyxobacteraceae bacterium]